MLNGGSANARLAVPVGTRASRSRPTFAITRFSPTSGTTSASVPIAARGFGETAVLGFGAAFGVDRDRDRSDQVGLGGLVDRHAGVGAAEHGGERSLRRCLCATRPEPEVARVDGDDAARRPSQGMPREIHSLQFLPFAQHCLDLGERLHPWVQAKWYELWDAWDQDPRKDLF